MKAIEGAISELYHKIALGGLGMAMVIAALSLVMARAYRSPG